MSRNSEYVGQLEEMIVNQLLPIYDKYYELIKEPRPELDVLTIAIAKKKVPALFKPKDGVLSFTSYERKPRKN